MGTRARTVSRLLEAGAGNVGAGGNLTISDILPLLTTANVIETSNLYYTNSRVNAYVWGNIITNLRLDDLKDVSTANANVGDYLSWDGAVWYPRSLGNNAVLGEFTTDDVPEGNINLYLSGKSTDDLPESANSYGNLYFSNARARLSIRAANPTIIYDSATGEISANLTAVAFSSNTTDTVPEGFVNKYYTNNRVLANLQTLSINVFSDVNVTGVTSGKVLVYDGGRGWWAPADNVFSAVYAEEANIILSLGNFTTANLVESGNLYYTNNRVNTFVWANVIPNIRLDDLKDVDTVGKSVGYVLTWNGSEWQANAVGQVEISASSEFAERSNVANSAANAIFSLWAANAMFATWAANTIFATWAANTFHSQYAEVANSVLTAANVDSLSNFTTDDLDEGNINLYFTNSRVYSNILLTSLNVHRDVNIVSTPLEDQVLTWDGNAWIAANSISLSEASLFSERSNIANLVLSLDGLDTDDLAEGSNNLYYTFDRVNVDIVSAISGKDIQPRNIAASGNLRVFGDSVIFDVEDFQTQSKTLVLGTDTTYLGSDGSGIYITGANANIFFSQAENAVAFNKNVLVGGNLLPETSGIFNIGSPTKYWRGLYIGSQTIYLGNLSLSEKPGGGGLEVKDTLTGELAEIGLSNVVSIESVTVDRIAGNIFPEVQLRSYIGGNVRQYTQGETGNLYVGILKGSNINQFAGMRITEEYTGANVNSYAIGSLTIVDGGNGYSDGNVEISFIGGAGGKGAGARPIIDSEGQIIQLILENGGYWYESVPNVIIQRANLFGTENYTNAIITASLDYGNIISKPRIQSKVSLSNDKEGEYLSTERVTLQGNGNVDITSSNVNITVKANSNVTINGDAVVTYNPLGQSLGLLRAAIEAPTGNVLYVSIDGDDNDTGTALSNSLANLHTALARANAWTTIFLKAGDYVLYDQPVTIKARVGIVGDNLRTTTVRPHQANVDMFYVENASYCTGITFRGHIAPAAVFSYNPDRSAGIITTSPYIQNCSSITTTGTGMRVDGAYVQGLRSMVCDSYTQTNSGGIGVHMLNRGYTQLVSVFTITCNIAILAEKGGFCSITNSNSSFGTYGLVARGVSDPLYYGAFVSIIETDEGQQLIVNNLTQKPNYGDVLIIANYNQDKCTRDTGLIVDSLAIDLAYNSNTQSNFAGLQYWAQAETAIPNQSEETLAAFEYAKNLSTNVIQSINIIPDRQANVSQVFGIPGGKDANINAEFDLIANIITGGTVGITNRIVPNHYPQTTDTDTVRTANLLIRNKEFIAAETVAYVRQTYLGFFDDGNNFVNYTSAANAEAICSRDVGYLIDSIYFDLLHGGNRQAIMAGVYYYNFNNGVTQIENQIQATSAAYDFIGEMLPNILTNTSIAAVYQTEVSQNTSFASSASSKEVANVLLDIDLITNIIENGPNVAEPKRSIQYTPSTDPNVINATKILLANRDFIVAEVKAYVNANWANITNNTDQQFYTVSNSTPLVGGSSNVTLLELLDETVSFISNSTISFHQPSYISASGHTFEYVGSGDELATALPYNGGMPIQENEVVETQGGRVYFTSTDQQGDFRIGTELTINRVDGTITGRTFNKSLFSVMTPYILAIEG